MNEDILDVGSRRKPRCSQLHPGAAEDEEVKSVRFAATVTFGDTKDRARMFRVRDSIHGVSWGDRGVEYATGSECGLFPLLFMANVDGLCGGTADFG